MSLLDIKGLTLNHYPDFTKPRSFNLELTKLAISGKFFQADFVHFVGYNVIVMFSQDDRHSEQRDKKSNGTMSNSKPH